MRRFSRRPRRRILPRSSPAETESGPVVTRGGGRVPRKGARGAGHAFRSAAPVRGRFRDDTVRYFGLRRPDRRRAARFLSAQS
jgi:hypothetical protein